jgi:hypothetical protein
MSRARLNSHLPLEYEAFLYASIEDDTAEMPLSVLSALARLDVDPWAEAAALAALPRGNATRRLVHLMAQLSDTPSARRDLEELSARLVALLPDHGGARCHELADALLTPKTHALRIGFLAGCLLGMQWVATSCQSPMSRLSNSPPAATSSSQQTPPGGSSK